MEPNPFPLRSAPPSPKMSLPVLNPLFFPINVLKLTYSYYSFSIQYALYISVSSPPHLKCKLVLAGINTTVPRLTVIDTEDVSMLPDPDIAIAILGPFKAWNLYMAQLDGI